MLGMIGTYAAQYAARLATRRLARQVKRLRFGQMLTIACFVTIGGLLGGYLTTHYGAHVWINYRPLLVSSLGLHLLGSLGR